VKPFERTTAAAAASPSDGGFSCVKAGSGALRVVPVVAPWVPVGAFVVLVGAVVVAGGEVVGG
jgi:hypothetical protein